MQRLTLSEVPEYSFFVKRVLQSMHFGASDEECLEDLARIAAQPVTRQMMVARLGTVSDSDALKLEMRKLRREVLVALVARNITGAADLGEVVDTMTNLAEVTISHTVRVESQKLAERFGEPCSAEGVPQDMLVVGMGKLGGAELNVSSDIDLIFVYDEAGDTRATERFPGARRSVSNHEFFERLAKRVIPALNDIDGTGFVFRVDMRLRPFGDAGPIVVSSSMLEEYLYTEGRDWERFAWLKGRVVNEPVFMSRGDFDAAVCNLNGLVRPFVFRKYVDFSAISALTRLHEMIRAETARREAGKSPVINVKLGRGGIREIEFITQTFQIIRGGREASLRGKQTRPMLRELSRLGVIEAEKAERLVADYEFLRDVEHALQYVDDKQTQTLSDNEEDRRRIAAMVGLSERELMSRLGAVRDFVSATFDGIFHVDEHLQTAEGWPVGWQIGDETAVNSLTEKLTQLGFSEGKDLAERIGKLLNSRLKASRSTDAKEQFSRFIVTLAHNAQRWAKLKSNSVSADELFHRYLGLLEVVSGRATYVALLNQYPAAAEKVGRMLAVSSWAADYLTAHPILLDELVDGRDRALDDYSPVDWSGWLDDLHRKMVDCEGDQERQLNLLRDAHHSAVFHLLLADLQGRFSVERLADQLSALADAVLELVIELAWQTIPSRHCESPRFAVIGYGKLGGKELGYASDLDIIFLYDDDAPEAEANYPKLVRRMMSWLTVQTSSGILFDIDMRLRPNGQNGLIASSMEMFRRYQRNEDGNGAWFWEHQALTRARFCAGNADVGRMFEQEREYILRLPRNPEAVADEVVKMREKMLDGHPNDTDQFDVKHDRGGMVDIEFAVQTLVLSFASRHPELVNNFGNTLLLEMAGRLGLVPAKLAGRCIEAYRHYRNIQREIRLSRGESTKARVPLQAVSEDAAAVNDLWRAVFHTDEPQRKS